MKNLISVLAVALVSVSAALADEPSPQPTPSNSPEQSTVLPVAFAQGTINQSWITNHDGPNGGSYAVTAGIGVKTETITPVLSLRYFTGSVSDSVTSGVWTFKQNTTLKFLMAGPGIHNFAGTGLYAGLRLGISMFDASVDLSAGSTKYSGTFKATAAVIGLYSGFDYKITSTVSMVFEFDYDAYASSVMHSETLGKASDYTVDSNNVATLGAGLALHF